MTSAQINILYPIIPSDEETAERTQSIVEAEFERMQDQILEEEIYNSDELDVDVDETGALADELRQMGALNNEETTAQEVYGVAPEYNYYPYPNKTSCYLDILDNLPRLRFSEAQFKMVIWLLKNTGAEDVPSFHEFRKIQEHIRHLCSVRVEEPVSDLGHLFSLLIFEILWPIVH
ncbi:hypothetical protein MPER_03544 [Moniliophthora perniciosa FA553]|nr:hypothetical protein MPER_03544 [Moniliophthora perniciosa FA553]